MIDLINNERDAQKLEENLKAYSEKHIGTYLPYINLLKNYKTLKRYDLYGQRLFAALADLKLNFISLTIDNFYSGALWNEQNAIKLLKNQSLLDNKVLFSKRLEIHRHSANYIPRYRAMWDKIMGILLLINSEDKYNKYNSTKKSRKKLFKSLSKDISYLPSDYVDSILLHIQNFDDKFRTSEIHRFGILRKYSFLEKPHEKNEYIQLKSSWNHILFILSDIDRLIDSAK